MAGGRIDSNQESLVRSVLNTWQQENMVSPSAVSVELIRAFCSLIETNDLGALGRCDRDSVLSAGPVGVVLVGLSIIQTNVASFMSIMFTEKELAAVVRAGGRRADGQFEPRRFCSIQQRRAYAVVRSTIFDLMASQMRGGASYGIVLSRLAPAFATAFQVALLVFKQYSDFPYRGVPKRKRVDSGGPGPPRPGLYNGLLRCEEFDYLLNEWAPAAGGGAAS